MSGELVSEAVEPSNDAASLISFLGAGDDGPDEIPDSEPISEPPGDESDEPAAAAEPAAKEGPDGEDDGLTPAQRQAKLAAENFRERAAKRQANFRELQEQRERSAELERQLEAQNLDLAWKRELTEVMRGNVSPRGEDAAAEPPASLREDPDAWAQGIQAELTELREWRAQQEAWSQQQAKNQEQAQAEHAQMQARVAELTQEAQDWNSRPGLEGFLGTPDQPGIYETWQQTYSSQLIQRGIPQADVQRYLFSALGEFQALSQTHQYPWPYFLELHASQLGIGAGEEPAAEPKPAAPQVTAQSELLAGSVGHGAQTNPVSDMPKTVAEMREAGVKPQAFLNSLRRQHGGDSEAMIRAIQEMGG